MFRDCVVASCFGVWLVCCLSLVLLLGLHYSWYETLRLVCGWLICFLIFEGGLVGLYCLFTLVGF